MKSPQYNYTIFFTHSHVCCGIPEMMGMASGLPLLSPVYNYIPLLDTLAPISVAILLTRQGFHQLFYGSLACDRMVPTELLSFGIP